MSSLQKSSIVGLRHLRRHGLGDAIIAGQVCRTLELASPVPVRAISYKEGVLHISVPPAHYIAFRLASSGLLTELKGLCEEKSLPIVTRFRLTREASHDSINPEL